VDAFWIQVLIQFLGGLLVVVAVGLAGRFAARFLRRRRRAQEEASGRPTAPSQAPLRVLVVLSRPLVAYFRQEGDERLVPTDDLATEPLFWKPVLPLSTPLSEEALERAFADAPAPIAGRILRPPTLEALHTALLDGYDALLFDGHGLEDGALAFEGAGVASEHRWGLVPERGFGSEATPQVYLKEPPLPAAPVRIMDENRRRSAGSSHGQKGTRTFGLNLCVLRPCPFPSVGLRTSGRRSDFHRRRERPCRCIPHVSVPTTTKTFACSSDARKRSRCDTW